LPVALAALLLAAPAKASLAVPVGFRVPATHGYAIHAIAVDGDARGERDGLILFVTRKGEGAAYVALRGATVTETSIEAEIGRLGRVDLHFVPSGKAKSERSPCGTRPFQIDSGRFEGRFDFEGEEEFTAAHATHAAGENRVLASFVCPGGPKGEGAGGNAPGAQLQVRRRGAHHNFELEATKNSPTRPARFRVEIEERRDGLVILRNTRATGGPSTFDFDVAAQTATLRPPAPFAGTARFSRTDQHIGRLSGGLTVDFPGRSNVSISNGRGSLQRWVANPSHPFPPSGGEPSVVVAFVRVCRTKATIAIVKSRESPQDSTASSRPSSSRAWALAAPPSRNELRREGSTAFTAGSTPWDILA
jgi:hypothetical protein